MWHSISDVCVAVLLSIETSRTVYTVLDACYLMMHDYQISPKLLCRNEVSSVPTVNNRKNDIVL